MGKRKAILDAALQLISERGFHGTPVSEIAERAKVGAGTVYRYFQDKEDLLNQLYLDTKAEMHAAMAAGIHSDMPFETLFKQFWLNTLEYYVSHPQAFSFCEQYAFSPFLTDLTRAAGAKVFSDLDEALARAIRDGVVQDLPGEMVASLLIGPLTSLAKKHLAGVLEMTEERRLKGAHAAWCAIRR